MGERGVPISGAPFWQLPEVNRDEGCLGVPSRLQATPCLQTYTCAKGATMSLAKVPLEHPSVMSVHNWGRPRDED